MRKIYNIYVLLVAVVAMAFTSCQGDDNNLDASNRRGATTFTANFDASRSYFGEKVDGAYPSFWSGDERVMLEIIDSEFLSIRPSESIAMDIVDEDGKYASFTATIEQEFNGGSVYAYVPAASWEYGTDSWGISSYFYKLPTTQTPTATSVDPAAHILRAECGFEGALPTDVDLTFEHVAAYGKLSIPALEGEDVQSVQIDLTGAWGTEYSYTLNVSELDEPTYWFACESDVIMAIGITAVTADKSYTYERTFESGSEVLFSIGHVRPLTIAGELIDPSQPEPTYPNCEIHYTATTQVEAHSSYPWSFDTFGANILSHDFNQESGEGVITFDTDVTTIGEYAFAYCDNLTSITIPDSVTTIGELAFWLCSSLTNITIPDSVTTIGYSTFNSCSSLISITIPDSVTTIGERAFYSCDNLTSITIPDSVTTIGKDAFCDCYNLTSVTIGDSVTTIGNSAFADCSSLTSVTIPDSVTTIGQEAFRDCDSLTSVTIGDSVTTIEIFAFSGCDSLTEFNGKFASEDRRCLIIDGTLSAFAPTGLTSYTIPDSVTTIGNSAFYYCPSLTSVTIPNSVTTIGYMAFEYCNSLTSITIPDSVTTIGYRAFRNCYSLTSVYCEATTPPSLGESDVFDSNASGRLIYVPAASVEAYKSAEYWSEYADAIVGYDFESGEVVEPEGNEANRKIHYTATAKVEMDWTFVTFGANILSHDFNEMSGEGVITFDADVTTIGNSAFSGCDSLTSVTIPDSVTTIGNYAFRDCDSLTSITIPDSVTTIGKYAFYSCDSLTSATIGDSITTIGDSAFENCCSLTSVTIGDSVTTIGDSAFENCRSLTNITIPDSVTTIGDALFSFCSSLTEFNGKFASEDGRCLIVDDTLNSFAPAGLTSYTIPDSVKTIGEDAFRYCYSLTSITIPDSVTTIGEDAFFDCDSLTSITIPDSVTTIEYQAFYSCDGLTAFNGKFASEDGKCLIVDGTLNSFALGCGATEYTIPDSVTTIGGGVFIGCNSLTSVTIPDSVTTIGQEAFKYCDSLTSVTIGDSVTTIGDWAFEHCKSLTSVYCEATTPPSLGGTGVFDNNASGRKIYVPAASVEAYKTADYWNGYADAIVGNGPTPEDTPITDISSPSLKAGDFVSLDGVLGIVYYNDSSVVKVMSVETTTCEWGLYGTSVGATDPDDGRVNVETVKANGCFDFLPGFVWCESLGEGWYFPTIVEMIELYDAKETMNASLSAYGYPQFEGYYWASSEYSSTNAAQFIAASCLWSSCSKSDATNKVCAIRVVNL